MLIFAVESANKLYIYFSFNLMKSGSDFFMNNTCIDRGKASCTNASIDNNCIISHKHADIKIIQTHEQSLWCHQ